MRKWTAGWLPFLVLGMVGFASGCGDDGGDGGGTQPPPPVDLSGTYELVSITQAGVTLGPPLATGTLTLTATTYVLDLVVPNQTGGQDMIHDEGTYSTSGDTWTQNSTTLPVQSVGTFTFDGTTLTVDVTAPEAVLTVWNKTG